MNKKRMFVLWSGGFDSTYLIWKLLSEGHIVYTRYINIVSNGKQTERELEAIKNIKPIFDKSSNFIYNDKCIDITFYDTINNSWCLSYPPLFLMLPYVLPNNIDEVAIGYVMNDDAISFLEDIKGIYYSMQGMCNTLLPTLTFPLIKNKKDWMWWELPEEIRQHVTWCESRTDEINKDQCPSCKRMAFILNKE